MPRPRKDGSLQLTLPLLTASEKVERRAYFEAVSGQPLGRHRRRRMERGEFDKPRGKILVAVLSGINKAIETKRPKS